jgi:hypothetical protein
MVRSVHNTCPFEHQKDDIFGGTPELTQQNRPNRTSFANKLLPNLSARRAPKTLRSLKKGLEREAYMKAGRMIPSEARTKGPISKSETGVAEMAT